MEDCGDKKAVLAAVKQNGTALVYASAKLQADIRRWCWRRCAAEWPGAAVRVSEELKADKEVVLAAVQ